MDHSPKPNPIYLSQTPLPPSSPAIPTLSLSFHSIPLPSFSLSKIQNQGFSLQIQGINCKKTRLSSRSSHLQARESISPSRSFPPLQFKVILIPSFQFLVEIASSPRISFPNALLFGNECRDCRSDNWSDLRAFGEKTKLIEGFLPNQASRHAQIP